MLERVPPPEPGEVCCDSAVTGSRSEQAAIARVGIPRMVHTGTWGGPGALAALRAAGALGGPPNRPPAARPPPPPPPPQPRAPPPPPGRGA